MNQKLVGREEEREVLIEALQANQADMISIVGRNSQSCFSKGLNFARSLATSVLPCGMPAINLDVNLGRGNKTPF